MPRPNRPVKNALKTRLEIIGRAVVQPYDTIEIQLGIYESVIPTPKLHLLSRPDIGVLLEATLRKLPDNDGDYWLFYLIKNRSSETCRITVMDEIYVDPCMA